MRSRAPYIVVLAVTVLAALSTGVGAVAAASARVSDELTATPLVVAERVQGAKARSSRLAHSDDQLLGRTDADPVPVLVKLDHDPLASYAGDDAGTGATSPAVTGRPLTPQTLAASRHGRSLRAREAELTRAMADAVPEVRIDRSLPVVYGGVAATVPANRARDLLAVPGVVAVQADDLRRPSDDPAATPGTPGGADGAEGARRDDAAGVAAEGAVVAVLDTGARPEHPVLARDLPAGSPSGSRATAGECAFGDDPLTPAVEDDACAGRLVGGRGVLDRYVSSVGGAEGADPSSARDADGHGTEVTAAVAEAAPGAGLLSYRACGPLGCYASDVMAALEAAILDGADVVTYGLDPGPDAGADAVHLALLDAHASGVVVVAGETADAGLPPWVLPAPTGAAGGPVAALARRAGAAAVVRTRHPSWTPAQVTSAVLLGTAGGAAPAADSPDLPAPQAVGLTLDETPERFAALSEDPSRAVHLNVATVDAVVAAGSLTTRRTLTSADEEPVTYRVTTAVPDGASVEVRPQGFTVAKGVSQVLTLTMTADGLAEPAIGEVRLVAQGRPTLLLPVEITPTPGAITVTEDCASTAAVAVGTTTSCRVTATNEGPGSATVSGTATVSPHLRVDAARTPAAVHSPRSAGLSATTLPGRAPRPTRLEPLPRTGYLPLDELGVDPVAVGDDEALNVDLETPVRLADATYDRLGITSNGSVVAGGVADAAAVACCSEDGRLVAARTGDVIAPFGTDLTGEGAPGIFMATVTDDTRSWVVIEWRLAAVGSGAPKTFQVWLGQGPEPDMTLTYPPDDVPDLTGLSTELVIGLDDAEGTRRGLRIDQPPSIPAGETSADLRLTASTPAPGPSVTYVIEVVGYAGGTATVATALTAAGAPTPAPARHDLEVTGPAPGEVEADVEEMARRLGDEGADPDRLADWAERMRLGTLSREGLARELARDPAWLGRVVDAAFTRITGVPPDDRGRAYWVGELASGASEHQLVAHLVGSTAFLASIDGDLASFVDATFEVVAGRPPGPEGRTYWLDRLGEGLSRAEVGSAIASSDEVSRRRATDLARLLLERDPSPAEGARWSALLRTGTLVDATAAILLGG